MATLNASREQRTLEAVHKGHSRKTLEQACFITCLLLQTLLGERYSIYVKVKPLVLNEIIEN